MRKLIHQFIDFIFNKSQYISGVCLIVLTIIGISKINEWRLSFGNYQQFPLGSIIYWFVVILALIFGIISIGHAKNIEQLESDKIEKGNKINDLETSLNEILKERSELFNSYIKLLVRSLNFTPKERISVYKVFEGNFILLGRSSINPILEGTGRPHYPVNEGFIGKGWAEGEFFIDDLPSPNAGRNKYYKAVNAISPIDQQVLEQLNMKSRTYFVYRLNGFDGSPNAITVFESEDEKAFTKETIIQKLAGVKQPLIMFIEKNSQGQLISQQLGLNKLGL